MTVTELFEKFCSNLVIDSTQRSLVAQRVARMVRCLNQDLRSLDSDSAYRLYVGSYGRNTAIPAESDIDLLFELPIGVFDQYNKHIGNGQSALLQAMRTSIRRTYPNTEIAADGQVVVVEFQDGTRVEVLGAFDLQSVADGDYLFPDSNSGGSWRRCKPRRELDAFAVRDMACNRNLVQLGRMARSWRDKNGVAISGMLIDTLAYQFIINWEHRDKSFYWYDYMVRDFFKFLAEQNREQGHWLAPGSGSHVRRKGPFEAKAREAYDVAVLAAANVAANEWWAASYRYRQIFGARFPE